MTATSRTNQVRALGDQALIAELGTQLGAAIVILADLLIIKQEERHTIYTHIGAAQRAATELKRRQEVVDQEGQGEHPHSGT